MKWIGLTGGIATGKSSAAKILRDFGVDVIDADEVAHRAYVESSPIYGSLLNLFGPSVLDKNKIIDRKKVSEMVFQDRTKLKALEEIIHPFVKEQVRVEREQHLQNGRSWVVYDVPLLFEKKMENEFDFVLLVVCDFEKQLKRLMKRNILTREQAQLRISTQMPLAEKMKKTQWQIDNNGNLAELKEKTMTVFKTALNSRLSP